jgi:hypothetical protein
LELLVFLTVQPSEKQAISSMTGGQFVLTVSGIKTAAKRSPSALPIPPIRQNVISRDLDQMRKPVAAKGVDRQRRRKMGPVVNPRAD